MKHSIQYLIRYLLLFYYLLIIYGSIFYPHFLYQTNNMYAFLNILYICLYTHILREIGFFKNQPDRISRPNSIFHKLTGNYIEKHYDTFAFYFCLLNIITTTLEKQKQIFNQEKFGNIISTIIMIIAIIAGFTYTLLYYYSIYVFCTHNQIIVFFLKNFLISIFEITESTVNKASATEKGTLNINNAENLEQKLKTNTIKEINPIIITFATGLFGTTLLKRPNVPLTYELIKKYQKKQDIALLVPIVKNIILTCVEIGGVGLTINTLIAAGEYKILHKYTLQEVFITTRIIDPITPFNEYMLNKNTLSNKKEFLDLIKNVNNKEDLDKLSEIFHKLPAQTRLNLRNEYEDSITHAKNKINKE